MRPIKLTMRAFGSYASEQVLDFRELGKRSFFLIHGPTGAGKTTILDAICFALYGETSGEERSTKQMRSAHAEPTSLTEVTFDFALGEETYRVHRVPEQEKPNQKKAGAIAVRTQATLFKRTGCTDDSQEGQPIAVKTNEVTEKIEALLGFKSKQFRQVVLLPQGKFRQLLMSGSQDKELVLEALFKTEIYKRIEEALKSRKRDLSSSLEQKSAFSKMILEQTGAESMDGLIKEREACSAAVADSNQKLANVRAAYNFAQKELDAGTQAKGKIDELRDSEQTLSLLNECVAEFRQKQLKLDLARKAAILAEKEVMLVSRQKEKAEAQIKADESTKQLLEAKENEKSLRLTYEDEEGRTESREEAKEKCLHLEEITVKVKELADTKKAASQAEVKYLSCSQQLEKLNAALVKGQKEFSDKQTLRLELETIAVGLAVHTKSFEDLKRSLLKRDALEKLKKELAESSEEHELLKQSVDAIEKHMQTQKDELVAIETSFQEGQAAILAAALEEGQACPVCGSKEHPQLAKAGEDLPTEVIIRSKKEEIKLIEAQYLQLQKDELAQEKKVSGKGVELQSIEENIGELARLTLNEAKEIAADAHIKVLQAEEARAKNLALSDELALLKKQIEQMTIEQGEVKAQVQEALSTKDRASAVLVERESLIPEELRDLDLLEKAKREALTRFNTLKKAFELAQSRLTQASQILAAAKTAQCANEDTRLKALQYAEAEERDFAERLIASGFAEKKQYENAKLPAAQIQALEQEIRRFDADLQGAKERWKRAEESASGITSPDLPALSEQAREAHDMLEQVIREQTAFEQKLNLLDKQIMELAALNDDTRLLEASYATLGRLADVASGENQFGITLQRYVLASLLDDVLVFSSNRLAVMSKGRYVLRRAKERTDARKTGGLDLEIDDAYTGSSRPVSTLSGGESFLASLCLALGLADVVQSYSGGIYLETIFIDEGFGSLDPESLDLAIRALMDLQKGGRLVGIISHVPELKERIDARLEVLPGRNGSNAYFAVS